MRVVSFNLEDEKKDNIFELLDFLVNKDTKRFAIKLKSLMEDQHPSSILMTIVWKFRQIWEFYSLSGLSSVDEAASTLKVNKRRMIEICKRLNDIKIFKIMNLLMEIDVAVKKDNSNIVRIFELFAMF